MSDMLGIWPVRVEAQGLAERLAQRLGGELFRPWERGESQKSRFQALFEQRSHWVLIMAAGIATRFIDGLMRDKHHDPAVVVVDEAGRYAIALLGGHEAGANALAYRVANAIGAIPVVTTATEAIKPLVVGIGCRKGVSEEQIARAVQHALALWGKGNGNAIPRNAALVKGGLADSVVPMTAGPLESGPMGSGPMGSGPMGGGPMGSGPVGSGPVGDGPVGGGPVGGGPVGGGPVGGGSAGGRSVPGGAAGGGLGADVAPELEPAVERRALRDVEVSHRAGDVCGVGKKGEFSCVRELVTVDLKANEPGLVAFSRRQGIPLRVIARHQIEGRSWVRQPSEWVRQSVGLDGVCEPCALIACGRGRLVVPKTTLDGVAVAVVEDQWEFAS